MWWGNRLTVRRAEGETFLWRRKRVYAIDPTFGDPRLAALRTAAKEGGAANWPFIREQLAAAEDFATGGEDLTFLIAGLQNVPGVERWIGDVIADARADRTAPSRPGADAQPDADAEPDAQAKSDAHAQPGAQADAALPLLLSGARHIDWAWQARGARTAEHVSDDRWALFRARLATAEEHLFEAVEREPAWAVPWYYLQISGRGRQVGPDVAERRFEATIRRAPGHAPAYRQHLQQLSRKWGGSHERMHAFARESMLAAPEGSPLGELVATAHLEEWLDISGDPESSYMSRPEVVRDLYEAAQRSVFSPEFARRRDWTLGFNAFAMAFALAGEYAAARPLFRALGKKRATEMPWRYLDGRSPLVPYLEWRNRVNR